MTMVQVNLRESAFWRLIHSGRVVLHIYRLPNVFGKWSRPHYNSAVATFCSNAAAGNRKYTSRPSGESYFMLHR